MLISKIDAKLFCACESRRDLALLLGVNVRTLTYFAFGGGKKYTTFKILKKSGDSREISAPVEGLKSIQRKLAVVLNDIYPSPSYVQGFVKDGSILKNANPHVGRRVVLNFDLKDYFPSITSNRIIGLFRAKPFCFNNEVASTLAGLLCNDGSIPQGAPTSPIMSNMICFRMDKQLCALGKRERITYTRYADDITFSTSRRRMPESILKRTEGGVPTELGGELIKIISSNYFDINPRKTRVSFGVKSKYVTGVKVNEKPNLSKKFIREVRSMLHAWEKFGENNAQKAFSEKYEGKGRSFVRVLRGKLAHIKSIKGDDDLLYRRLYNKFVVLEGVGRSQLPIGEIQELYEKIYVVKSGAKTGSGFILDGKWLITCDHTIEEDDVEYFTHTDYIQPLRRHTRSRTEHRSATFDIAVLAPQVSDTNNPTRSFDSAREGEDVIVGSSYRVLGFPNYFVGSQPHLMKVDVTSIQRDKNGILSAHVDKKLVSGSSGSPVLNDSNQVVGVVMRGTKDWTTGDDSTGYEFLPVQELRKCLQQLGLTT